MFHCPRPALLAVVLTSVIGAGAASPAAAGPPLLCHPFEIAGARSLPWGDAHSWSGASPAYRLSNLVADTEALLAGPTDVIVRMETLRRAAIYASRDPDVAARLFAALTGRAQRAEQSGRPDALAYLDAGYYIEALRQASTLERQPGFAERAPMLGAIVRGSDGYALAAKALALRQGDPAMEFAAALIAAERRPGDYARHAERARAGASRDALLAMNIGQVRE